MMALARTATLTRPLWQGLNSLSPLIDLGIRLWVANVFWKSAMVKIASWETTLLLFTHEYQVPLLAPAVAATLATAIELVFPVLLVIGLGTRISALVLFLFNIAAVVSYPALNEIGIKDHTYWGLLLLVTLLHGPGKLSLDHWLRRRWLNGS